MKSTKPDLKIQPRYRWQNNLQLHPLPARKMELNQLNKPVCANRISMAFNGFLLSSYGRRFWDVWMASNKPGWKCWDNKISAILMSSIHNGPNKKCVIVRIIWRCKWRMAEALNDQQPADVFILSTAPQSLRDFSCHPDEPHRVGGTAIPRWSWFFKRLRLIAAMLGVIQHLL